MQLRTFLESGGLGGGEDKRSCTNSRKRQVICALSGGVDSTVAAVLTQKGDRG